MVAAAPCRCHERRATARARLSSEKRTSARSPGLPARSQQRTVDSMQVWSVPATAPRASAHDAAAALVGCIARDDFATRALGELNLALPVAWWTVYRVFDDQPPQLFAQASHAVPDIALDCWRIYRSGVYRDDTHFAEACDRAG